MTSRRGLPNVSAAPLPANYIAACDAMRALDRLTRKLASRPLPQSLEECRAELQLWQLIVDSPELNHGPDRIMARAIIECGRLLKAEFDR